MEGKETIVLDDASVVEVENILWEKLFSFANEKNISLSVACNAIMNVYVKVLAMHQSKEQVIDCLRKHSLEMIEAIIQNNPGSK